MGLTNSKFDEDIRKQESYVNKRMKDPDMVKLSKMRGGLFYHDGHKYNHFQLKGYLRQEYHGTRKHDSYVLDQDLRFAGAHHKRTR